MAQERIIPIPGHDGYFVSDQGEVYSAWAGSGRGAYIGGSLKKMKLIHAPDGRVQVNMRRKTYRVANLVLTAFFGPRPQGMEACHFPDRDTANNAIGNLRWDTPAGNQRDKVFHGTSNHGERNGSARLTEDAVRLIRRRCGDGATHKSLAEFLGVSRQAVQEVVARTTWREVQ